MRLLRVRVESLHQALEHLLGELARLNLLEQRVEVNAGNAALQGIVLLPQAGLRRAQPQCLPRRHRPLRLLHFHHPLVELRLHLWRRWEVHQLVQNIPAVHILGRKWPELRALQCLLRMNVSPVRARTRHGHGMPCFWHGLLRCRGAVILSCLLLRRSLAARCIHVFFLGGEEYHVVPARRRE